MTMEVNETINYSESEGSSPYELLVKQVNLLLVDPTIDDIEKIAILTSVLNYL